MTMSIYRRRTTPASTALQAQQDKEDLERIFPLLSNYIQEVLVESLINPNGWTIPPNWLPPATDPASTPLPGLDKRTDLVIQYRDESSLFVNPGHVLHRGAFRRQTLDEDTNILRVVNAAASLLVAAACQPATPGNSGLDPDTWYYCYYDLTVATTYPGIVVCPTPPTREEGYGPELEAEGDGLMRYAGAFRTGPAGDAEILPYHRNEDGQFLWRERRLGPYLWQNPEDNLVSVATGGWVEVDLSEFVPPTATAVFLTAVAWDNNSLQIRAKGDTGANSGFDWRARDGGDSWGIGWCEVPMHAIDPATAQPYPTVIEMNNEDAHPAIALRVVGFRESV